MGRSSIDDFWLNKINELTANFPKLGPKAAAQRFEKDAECAARDDWPSESTIGRYQRKFRQKDPTERVGYGWFRWPESMEEGLLPWEASAAALELLRFLYEKGPGRVVVVVGIVRWFWRLTMAAPELHAESRYEAASFLHFFEATRRGLQQPAVFEAKRALEAWLAYKPYLSQANKDGYEAAIKRLGIGLLSIGGGQ